MSIAQMVIQDVPIFQLTEVNELSNRSEGHQDLALVVQNISAF